MSNLAAGGRQWVLMPWYLGQLMTAAKSFEANPVLGSPRLNELGLHRKRVILADRLAQKRRARLADSVSEDYRRAYERDGFVVRRNFLPQNIFDQLLAEIKQHRCVYEDRSWGETINRRHIVDAALTAKIPALKQVLNSKEWRALVAYVGACPSTPLVYVQSLYRRGGEIDPQTRLHLDTFHSTAKAWLYLTDVREHEGAFTYVPGSHRLTPQKLEWLLSDQPHAKDSADQETREGSFRIEASELAALGLPQPVELAVPANTLVVGNTSGFHARGRSRANTLRVEIWALGRRQPFLTWGGLEPWSSEALGSMVSALQAARDNLNLKSRRWTLTPDTTAFDFSHYGPVAAKAGF